MRNIIIINPDHYLETESGRIWSVQHNKIAWQHSYNDFESSLMKWKDTATVYIVFGVQAAGKTAGLKTRY
jgi:predicted AAA+ superfamily ATPase